MPIKIPLLAFVNNETIATVIIDNVGIEIWKIVRENGVVGLSYSHTILKDFTGDPSSTITSFVMETKTILAFDHGGIGVTIHEINSNKSIKKSSS